MPSSTAATDEPRRRDAARTKQSLLAAARELFGTHGFAGTTLRHVGERAGVDPALVARYFGNKTALYIASLEAEPADESGHHFDAARVEGLLARTWQVGASPVLSAALVSSEDPEVRAAAHRIVEDRLVEPISRRLDAAGVGPTRLRAEVVTAALAGILLARGAGTLETLRTADHDEVVAVVTDLCERMLER